jgi:hypothetical protein
LRPIESEVSGGSCKVIAIVGGAVAVPSPAAQFVGTLKVRVIAGAAVVHDTNDYLFSDFLYSISILIIL